MTETKQPKQNWFAVVNPSAGSGKTLAQWREAEPVLFREGIQYEFVKPESKQESTNLILNACSSGYRKFIAVGGDGTVHNLLRCIVEFVDEKKADGEDTKLDDFTLAVLPIGSGNDWLKSHNLPHDHEKIIRLLARGSFAKQDVVKAEIIDSFSGKTNHTAYMANVGGYAFDANVCDVVNFQKSHGATGKLMYINALKNKAFSSKPTMTKIVCDGKEVFNDLLFTASFGNGKYSGGGLVQTPSAIMDDGILDLMVVPKISFWDLFFNIGKFIKKKTDKIYFLQFYRGKSFEIIPTGQGELVEVDGDIIGRAPARMSIMNEQINVLHIEQENYQSK